MRGVWAIVVIAVALAGYWVWPYLGAYTLASAAEHGNETILAARIDLPALQRSLARQIVEAYLRRSGRAKTMGAWEHGLATAVGTSVATPYLERLVSPQAIQALLAQGRFDRLSPGDQGIMSFPALPTLHSIFSDRFLAVLMHSSYDGIASFRFEIPGSDVSQDDFGIHLRLNGLVWRLSGVDLPENLLDRIADEVIAREKAASAAVQ